MKYCPITYEAINDHKNYSTSGLKQLARQLTDLKRLAYTADEQRQQAIMHAHKMSVQGVQVKFSAKLKITAGEFEIVAKQGQYLLKPQSLLYRELPENEAITMTLASLVGIEVPVHGLVYSKDNSMTYFVKRFDRLSKQQKLAVEDFAQLSASSRATKYASSMEKVVKIVNQYCSFPKTEHVKLFKLVLFSFLIGNEDMHLKNFSLITKNDIIKLSPAYDLLNTTIAQPSTIEEMALPLNGKKNNFKKIDFIDYLGLQVLQLNPSIINEIIQAFKNIIPKWRGYINKSFLSDSMKDAYLKLLEERSHRLDLI